MPRRPHTRTAFAAVFFSSLLACLVLLCAARPVPAFFTDVTVVDEAEMGREFDKMLRNMVPMVEDPLITEYVERVVKRVFEAMPPQPFRIKTAVINHSALNAFAVPGGYVYVFTGLLAQLETEDQFAAVVAHELAHVSQRHVADRMEKMEEVGYLSLLGSLAGIVVGSTSSGGNTAELGQALAVGSQAAGAAAYLTYTQENEREADHVGIQYLTAAGYNPAGMPETFDIMKKNQFRGRSSKLPPYLSTHPRTAERSNYLRQRVASMAEEVRQRGNSVEQFRRVQAVVRGKMSDPVWAEAMLTSIPAPERTCMDQMALGIVSARLKRTQDARDYFTNALACGGDDPLVLREAGRYYFMEGDFRQAGRYLQKALFKNPGDLYSLYYNARLMGEQGQYTSAIKYLRQILEKLPEDGEVHYYLGRYLGQDGQTFQAHLHLAYSAMYGRDPKQARFHARKAEALANTPEKTARLDTLRQDMAARYDD